MLRRLFSWSMPAFGLSPSISVPVQSLSTREALKEISLDPKVFNEPLRRDIVHNVFHYYRFMHRQTTHRVLRYGEISGSGQKMRPQKKTGKARMGYKRVSHLYKGGKVHGPVPRDYSFPMNKKVVVKALKIILSSRLAEGNLHVVDSYPTDIKKTNQLHNIMKDWGRCLVIGSRFSDSFLIASRNINYLTLKTHDKINVKDIVLVSKVIISEDAIYELQKNILDLEAKLYSNRKFYRKIKEEAKEVEEVKPVPITFKPLREIAEKFDIKID